MEPKIIFEDKVLLILDKPPGWIVNEAGTTNGQSVVQTWLAENFDYEIAQNRIYRSGIAHRLDKETSGILVVAKTAEAFENLQSQFKNREVKKTYTSLVHGKVEPKEGEVKASVGRLPWKRDRFGIVPGGRVAETKYKRIAYYVSRISSREGYSLLKLYPKTGRTHQIRIHLKYLGHPIVADEFYAGRKTARADRKWCPRLFLHASKIKFCHPSKGSDIFFESVLPEDLASALKSLDSAQYS